MMRAPCRRVLHAAAMTVSSLLSAGDLESGTNAIYTLTGEIDDDSLLDYPLDYLAEMQIENEELELRVNRPIRA
jgi:hypothetical protein